MQVLCEIETDKTSVPVPSPGSGVITELLVEDGTTVQPGAQLLKIQLGPGGAKPAAAPAWPEPDPFAPSEGKPQVAAPVPKQHHVAVVSSLRGRTRPKTRALIEAEEELKRKQLEQQVWV